MALDERLRIEVVYCPAPGQIDQVHLQLAAPSSVADALSASGVLERQRLSLEGLRVGIWGKASELDAPLRDRDRIELYRPLIVDPKEARRQRYKRHRSAAADKPPSDTPTR